LALPIRITIYRYGKICKAELAMAIRHDLHQNGAVHRLGAIAMQHRLEQILEARGLNQSQLARRMDLPPTSINRLVNGDRKMTLDWMQRIAAALDLRASDLLAEKDFRNRLAGDEARVLRHYRDLRPADRLRAFRIMAVLADAADDADAFFDGGEAGLPDSDAFFDGGEAGLPDSDAA
jgi:transcriptional regulator with XRE-family HTH domain